MSPILKIKKHNENKEIDFELNFLLSLSVKERFKMMLQKSDGMKRILRRNENRKITKVIKRA